MSASSDNRAYTGINDCSALLAVCSTQAFFAEFLRSSKYYFGSPYLPFFLHSGRFSILLTAAVGRSDDILQSVANVIAQCLDIPRGQMSGGDFLDVLICRLKSLRSALEEADGPPPLRDVLEAYPPPGAPQPSLLTQPAIS